jgi:hypothetical protein
MTPHWFTAVDGYCERIDASFWSEPVNAISNGAFLVAAAYAFVLWRRDGGRDRPALWLIFVTMAVGIGSFLFHTFANRWSLLADVLPITLFIYSYFLIAMRRYLDLGGPAAFGMTAAFAAFNIGFERLWRITIPEVTLNGSVGYLPAALALLVVGSMCLLRAPRATAGQGLLLATVLFGLSLVFRSIDEAACDTLPLGTHFLWHILNAAVLLVLIRTALDFRAEPLLPKIGAKRA